MACVSDPSRFQLVGRLAAGESCVSDLARRVGLSQSCTTRHLQVLARHGVARGRRDGKRVLFQLCTERATVRALLRWALSSAVPSPDRPDPPARTRPRRRIRSRAHAETRIDEPPPRLGTPPEPPPMLETRPEPPAASSRSDPSRPAGDGAARNAGDAESARSELAAEAARPRRWPIREELEDFLL